MPRPETTPSQPRRGGRRTKGRARTGRRLFAFDRELGCRYVAGADEAGRGSLAGPLVAAAVMFDLERLTLADRRALSRLNDSKQHTAEMREELYPLVMRAAARSVIVSRCVRGIDSRGLHKTNLEALRTALLGVAVPDAICLVDGFNVPEFGFEQRAVVDGDCRSAAIAAASRSPTPSWRWAARPPRGPRAARRPGGPAPRARPRAPRPPSWMTFVAENATFVIHLRSERSDLVRRRPPGGRARAAGRSRRS
jgi:ribonuclease HII